MYLGKFFADLFFRQVDLNLVTYNLSHMKKKNKSVVVKLTFVKTKKTTALAF